MEQTKPNKSALAGTTWYWRTGRHSFPIGSGYHSWTQTEELCLPISDNIPFDEIKDELLKNHIQTEEKEVHSSFSGFPSGTEVLYAFCPKENPSDGEEDDDFAKNLDALYDYIKSHGGKIHGENRPEPQAKKEQPKLDLRSLLKWFGR